MTCKHVWGQAGLPPVTLHERLPASGQRLFTRSHVLSEQGSFPQLYRFLSLFLTSHATGPAPRCKRKPVLELHQPVPAADTAPPVPQGPGGGRSPSPGRRGGLLAAPPGRPDGPGAPLALPGAPPAARRHRDGAGAGAGAAAPLRAPGRGGGDRRTHRQTDRQTGQSAYVPPEERGGGDLQQRTPKEPRSSRRRLRLAIFPAAAAPPRTPGRQRTIAARGATPAAAGRGAEGAARHGADRPRLTSPRLPSAGARRRRAQRGLGPRPGEAVPGSGRSPLGGAAPGRSLPVPKRRRPGAGGPLGRAGQQVGAGGSSTRTYKHTQSCELFMS